MRVRSYRELRRIETFNERFDYLSLKGQVGSATFGYDRYLNQAFYTSREWRRIRDAVIIRDNGCDLGIPGYEIHDKVIIHHMNPMTIEDIEDGNPSNLDPDNLICVTHRTHNAIHYGDANLLPKEFIPRSAGDTKLW